MLQCQGRGRSCAHYAAASTPMCLLSSSFSIVKPTATCRQQAGVGHGQRRMRQPGAGLFLTPQQSHVVKHKTHAPTSALTSRQDSHLGVSGHWGRPPCRQGAARRATIMLAGEEEAHSPGAALCQQWSTCSCPARTAQHAQRSTHSAARTVAPAGCAHKLHRNLALVD
jgi:hypothetical protein